MSEWIVPDVGENVGINVGEKLIKQVLINKEAKYVLRILGI